MKVIDRPSTEPLQHTTTKLLFEVKKNTISLNVR